MKQHLRMFIPWTSPSWGIGLVFTSILAAAIVSTAALLAGNHRSTRRKGLPLKASKPDASTRSGSKEAHSSSTASFPAPPPSSSSSAPSYDVAPRVFSVSSNGTTTPVVTGESLMATTAAAQQKAKRRPTGRGHRVEGVTVTQRRSDGAFVVRLPGGDESDATTQRGAHYSPPPPPGHDASWCSGALPLENSATWWDDDDQNDENDDDTGGGGVRGRAEGIPSSLRSLPKRHPYCRASACALAVDAEGSVLLTRRRRHMRTFPGAWVCAGGGVDGGAEGLEACALRELFEETGLQAAAGPAGPAGAADDACGVSPGPERNIEALCFWESFYPTSPEDCAAQGEIKAHHLVAFFVVRVAGVRPRVALQVEETDAFVWVPERFLAALADASRSAAAPLQTRRIEQPGAEGRERGVSDLEEAVLVGCELAPDDQQEGEEERGERRGREQTTRPLEVPLAHLATRYDSSAGNAAFGSAEAHLYAFREYARRFA